MTEQDSNRPEVFVSYSPQDQDFVQQLVAALRDRGVKVWFDQGKLRVGDSMLHSLADALEASQYFLFVLSPHLVSSNWVPFELGVALGRKESRLLPLYLNATPEEVHREFPFLRNRIGISAQEHSVPEIAEQIAAIVAARHGHAESAQQAS